MRGMSFAILRHAKIDNSTKGAAVSHNHRLSDIEKININPAQKHLNKLFMGEGAKTRIDAKLPAKFRKDAIVAVEVLLTASPEFFNGLTEDREQLSKNPVFLAWVDQSLKWAKKEFGANLVDASLHMDESSPHIHVLTVPLIEGRLCAKEVTARKEMQRRQTEYAKAMKPFGLLRGEPASETKRKHIGLKDDPGSGGKSSKLAGELAAQVIKTQIAEQRTEFLEIRNEVIRTALIATEQKLAAAQQAQGQVVAGKDAELVKERQELVKAQAQFAAEKTRLEQVIERLKATVERLTNRLLGLEEKLGALKATPAPVQVPAALAEDTKLALVEKYKSVGRGVAPGAIKPSWLEDAVLVEQQNGIAVYRHGGVHFIQPALEQTELERQGIQKIQKSGVGR